MKLLKRFPDEAFRREEAMRAEITRLQGLVTELTRDRDALEAQIAGRPRDAATWWQSKGMRQRKALDILNLRVHGQRFILRLANELGHLPDAEEVRKARDTMLIGHPEAAARIDDYAVSVLKALAK